MQINAVIVAYNNPKKMLDAAVNSVLNEKEYIHQLYMIDNSPSDKLRQYFTNSTHYIFTGENLGFGKANNIAIQKSIDDKIKYHLLVNPDISFEKGVIKYLLSYMDENSDIGLVMPKIIYPDGSTQYLCKLMPTPFDLIARRFLSWGPFKHFTDKRNEFFELRDTGYNIEMDVPILSGSFMLIRTSILEEIGFFDERYFMYLEDFDLCRRIGEVSRTVYNPAVSVIHEYEKGSYFKYRLFKYHIDSAIKYFNKWGWIFDTKRSKKNKECLEKLN